MKEERNNFKNILLFAAFLSGAVTFIIFIISFVAELFLQDPILLFGGENTYLPSRALIKMLCYLLFVLFFFIYVPFKLGVQEHTISKKSGIVMVTLLTYLISSAALAFFLSFATDMIDYESLSTENLYTKELIDKEISCTFDLRESFFDAVSGFTTTGLTAFRKTNVDHLDGREISKIDAQPKIIHIIRATYLWIGGLGIMFFYLYFTPVPSLMMSMSYEIPTERSLPRFIRLEGMSFSLVYGVITAIGIFLLFFSISSASSPDVDEETALTYSVVLAFSSISTGGFAPGSAPIDQAEIEEYTLVDDLPDTEEYRIINNWGLLVLMFLMFAGAMPIFSMHRPLKFLRRWKIFAAFLLPVALIAAFSYVFDSEKSPEASFYRAFDALSAFTTTGLSTSQFEKDFEVPMRPEHGVNSNIKHEEEEVRKIFGFRLRSIYMITLMFIGGAAYSTAGGWGFFSFWCIMSALYLITTGKLERVLTRYLIGLILSFIIFFSVFAIGTTLCYKSELFGTIAGPDPEAVADYVINAAFYEISALSTVGLMPDYMISNGDIYHNNLAYWTLAISMLIGRLYYIIFPFLVTLIAPEGEL